MTASPANSTGQLEWELSLPETELVSRGWYRGSLSRAAAEADLPVDGHFLVRDSSTQPGNYVLSCKHAGQYLHFVINRIIIQPETVYERYQYQFEDEAYDTVADLVTSYVGSNKPISAASGARITTPSNRKLPLLCCPSVLTTGANPAAAGKYSYKKSPSLCCPSGLHNLASHPTFKSSTSTDPLPTCHKSVYNSFQTADIPPSKSKEEPDTKQSNEGNHSSSSSGRTTPPAKPARMPQLPHHTSGSDSGNGSGDSQTSAAGEPLRSGDERWNGMKREIDAIQAEARIMTQETTEFVHQSKFDLEAFRSTLFSTPDNKPLESDTLQAIKLSLRTSGPRILANHLTSIDIKIVLGENGDRNISPLYGTSGIELCLLPHGHQMRQDLIERVESLKLLIAVTILTCQSDVERADVINDWIQLAIETKTALGNLFGFSTIMLGLCMPQVECLENAWLTLRQRHTEAAFSFEAKLRPCFKNMNDGVDPAPPNTTLPHLMPILSLIDNTDMDKWWEGQNAASGFGSNNVDFGLTAVGTHLETARKFPDQVSTFRRNARTVVQEMSSLGSFLDPLLLDIFHTEFHIKFLWGNRGALSPAPERRDKLTNILTAMSQKFQHRPLAVA